MRMTIEQAKRRQLLLLLSMKLLLLVLLLPPPPALFETCDAIMNFADVCYAFNGSRVHDRKVELLRA